MPTTISISKLNTYSVNLESDAILVANVGTLTGIPPELPRCQLGVKFFDGAGAQVTPTAGTVAFEFMSAVNGLWETLAVVPSFPATAPVTSTFYLGVTAVRATMTGITGAVNYKICIISNQA